MLGVVVRAPHNPGGPEREDSPYPRRNRGRTSVHSTVKPLNSSRRQGLLSSPFYRWGRRCLRPLGDEVASQAVASPTLNRRVLLFLKSSFSSFPFPCRVVEHLLCARRCPGARQRDAVRGAVAGKADFTGMMGGRMRRPRSPLLNSAALRGRSR